MNIIKIITSVLFISLFSLTFSYAEDCSKYDKLSKEYAKCTAELIKEKTSEKFTDSKKKLNKLNLKEKLIKFKNSKSHKEFTEE